MKKIYNYKMTGSIQNNQGYIERFEREAGNSIMLPKWYNSSPLNEMWVQIDFIETNEHCSELEIFKLRKEILDLKNEIIDYKGKNMDLINLFNTQNKLINKLSIPWWKRRKDNA